MLISFGAPFSGPQTGGTKRFCELTNYYNDDSDYDLTLCSTDSFNDLPRSLNHIKLDPCKNIGGIMPPTYFMYKGNRELLLSIKDNFDYIIAFEATTVFWLSILNYKNIIMLIRKDLIAYKTIEMNSDNVNYLKKKLTIGFYKFAEVISLMKSKITIVQCNYDKDQLLSRHKVYRNYFKNKILVQINNVNPSWIVRNSKDEADSSIFKYNNSFKICYIGNFESERKGYKLLLESLEFIASNNEDSDVFFVGTGKNLDKVRLKYSNYKNYHFLGYLVNPIKILKACDLVVVPSLADSFPNTVMESIYNNVPVIASNVGGIPEILKDDIAIFDPNIESLSNKLLSSKDVNFLENLKTKQFKRRNELVFNWAERIANLINERLKD